jgi:hypothetical protein
VSRAKTAHVALVVVAVRCDDGDGSEDARVEQVRRGHGELPQAGGVLDPFTTKR